MLQDNPTDLPGGIARLAELHVRQSVVRPAIVDVPDSLEIWPLEPGDGPPDVAWQAQARALLEGSVARGLVVELGVSSADLGCMLLEAGYDYLGLSADASVVQALTLAGLRAEVVDPAGGDRLLALLDQVGPIVALCLTSGLDRLREPERLLQRLSAYALARNIEWVLLTAPNVGHRDVALGLLSGHWRPGPGVAPLHFFTRDSLTTLVARSGWSVATIGDVSEDRSPSFDPESLLHLPTLAGDYIRHIADLLNPDSRVSQFVWVLTPSRFRVVELRATTPSGPLISFFVRTQGRRDDLLTETLYSIYAQTSQDYEILLCVHDPDDVEYAASQRVEELVTSLPTGLRAKIRQLRCTRMGRGAPLNDMLTIADGKYACVLDDDDLLFEHHVETLRQGIEEHGVGPIFQTFAAQRLVDGVARRPGPAPAEPGSAYPYSTRSMTVPWTQPFDPVQQHLRNQVPVCCMAIPISLIRQTRIRFREDLEVGEDWELWMQATELLRVVTVPEITALVNHWNDSVTNAMRRPDAAPLWRTTRDGHHSTRSGVPLLLDGRQRRHIKDLGALSRDLDWLRRRCGDLEGRSSKLKLQKERLELRVMGLHSQIVSLKADVAAMGSQLQSRDARLSTIYGSRTWRLGEYLWKVRSLLDRVVHR